MLRVIVLSDTDAETARLTDELARAGLEVEARHVEGGDGLKAAFGSFAPDLVLAWGQQSSCAALQVLVATQRVGPDIPLILIDDTPSEETSGVTVGTILTACVRTEDLSTLGSTAKEALAVAADMRERQAAAQELAASHALLQTIIESVPARVFWKDSESRYLGSNTLFARDAGMAHPEELVGLDDFAMSWRSEAALYRADDKLVMESGQPKTGYAEPQTTHDGSKAWLRTSKVPLRDERGQVIGVLGIYDDITERRLAEERLHESEDFIKAVLDNLPVGVAVNSVAPDVTFSYMNDSFSSLYRTTRAQLAAPDAFWEAVYQEPEFREQMRRRVLEDCASGETVRMYWPDVPITRRGQGTTYVSARNIPLPDKQLTISLVWDVTEAKRAEQSLEAARVSAEQSERTLAQANRALKALSASNRALIHNTDERVMLAEMCGSIVEHAGYLQVWAGFAPPGAPIQVLCSAGYPGADHGADHESAQELARGLPDWVLDAGGSLNSNAAREDSRLKFWDSAADRFGFRSFLVLPSPMTQSGRGVLCIYSLHGDAFTDEEVQLLQEMAEDMAYGIRALRRDAEHLQTQLQLQSSMEQTVQVLAGTLEMRDPYTAGHQRRVAELSAAMAREMKLPEIRVHGIHLAAMIHDLGKINIPAELLSKPTRLTALEYKLIQTHSQSGFDILKDIDFPWPIAAIVVQHHERMDGSGYPFGLSGDAILLEARIVAVADTVEAMASHRPYRAALGVEKALAEIEANRGRTYDASVVDACLKVFGEGGFAFS